MTKKNIGYLKDYMLSLGFPARIAEQINDYRQVNNEDFHIYYSHEIEEEQLMYNLHFTKGTGNSYQFKEYELTLKNVPIPDLNIKGINTRDLDDKLKEVDSWYNKFLDGIGNSMTKSAYEKVIDFMKATNNDLYQLAGLEEGKQDAKLLMYKYFPENEYEKVFPDYKQMQELYELKHAFLVNGNTALTVMETYNFLRTTTAYQMLRKNAAERLNKTNLFTQKINIMNQKNFDYLKDQVKFTGFGEGLETKLKERMEKQSPEFELLHKANFGKEEAIATLHFKKSNESDIYFFNKYELALKPERNPEIMEQTFFINKGNTITLKEAYNLMNGRSINKDQTNKEGQVYNAWMQMDFKETDNNGNYKIRQFHQNYGYNLESELSKHPIKELMHDQEKFRLTQSLQKGNRQSVTFIENGNEQKYFIEANPQFKTINIYDNNMQRLSNRQSKEEKQAQGESESVKQEAKKEGQNQGDDDGPEIPKAAKKKRKKQNQSVS